MVGLRRKKIIEGKRGVVLFDTKESGVVQPDLILHAILPLGQLEHSLQVSSLFFLYCIQILFVENLPVNIDSSPVLSEGIMRNSNCSVLYYCFFQARHLLDLPLIKEV